MSRADHLVRYRGAVELAITPRDWLRYESRCARDEDDRQFALSALWWWDAMTSRLRDDVHRWLVAQSVQTHPRDDRPTERALLAQGVLREYERRSREIAEAVARG